MQDGCDWPRTGTPLTAAGLATLAGGDFCSATLVQPEGIKSVLLTGGGIAAAGWTGRWSEGVTRHYPSLPLLLHDACANGCTIWQTWHWPGDRPAKRCCHYYPFAEGE